MAEFEFTVDVVVAGGGACGCIAALAAHEAGASVLVIERDARPAGSTAMSQGLICAAGTAAQAGNGVADDAEAFLEDILAKTRGQTDTIIARMIAAGSGPTLDWMTGPLALPLTLDTRFRPAYGHRTLRIHGWEDHSGADLIQLLHQRLAEADIPVLVSARLTEIVANPHGHVRGVAIARPGGGEERIGCGALVLATGGFAANQEMVARHMPEAAAAHYNGHEGNVGDGIRLGAALGGALGDMGSYQGYAMLTDPQGISVPPNVLIEGGVLVNTQGARFIDESEDIAGMLHPVMAQPGGLAWVVFDQAIEQRCAHIPEIATLRDLSAAKRADSADELARAIGADPTTLAGALAEPLEALAGRRRDAVGRDWTGEHPPEPPYRALRVKGALYHTQGGLQIDAQARVLRADGSPLPNMFAGGGAARGVSGPSSWGYLPAMGLCAAVTTGRVAGQAAAALTGSSENSR